MISGDRLWQSFEKKRSSAPLYPEENILKDLLEDLAVYIKSK